MSHVVVSLRMSHAGVQAGAQTYLERARGMMARAEALGAILIAWSAQSIAFAFDAEGIEEAMVLAASVREDAAAGWSCGVAEGPISEVAAGRGTLAWGEALVLAESLARMADVGEALADERVTAVRLGELATLGVKASTDAGKRVAGLKVDLARPWKKPSTAKMTAVHVPAPPSLRTPSRASIPTIPDEIEEVEATSEPIDLEDTGEIPVPSFVRRHDDLEPGALELADSTLRTMPPAPSVEARVAIADRMEAISGAPRGAPTQTIIALMKARSRAEGPVARCQAALALAVGLAMAGRSNEALLEGLEALARARETGDVKAAQACLALLAKLYQAEGRTEDATLLSSIAQ